MSQFHVLRLQKELNRIKCGKDGGDFFVYSNPQDLTCITVIIMGPKDSLYYCKFVRIELKFNEHYPMYPPKAKFTNYRGNSRIHPNLYASGKVCLSILGTWIGPSWSASMGLDLICHTIQSLLDDKPYCHEPNKMNCKDYNKYVFYQTFYTCLKDYIEKESIPELKNYMISKTLENKDNLLILLDPLPDFCVISCPKYSCGPCKFEKNDMLAFIESL